jgi:hypothetical protein
MATVNEVYGRSDLQSFAYGDHTHTFTNPKNRKPFPAFGNDDRTLPVLPCVQCRDFAVKHLGFNADPTKVETTSDEQEYAERFQREGSMETQMMMREAGRAIADLLAAQKASKTK